VNQLLRAVVLKAKKRTRGRQIFNQDIARRLVLCVIVLPHLISCTYLKYAAVQEEYKRIQEAEPGQVNVKHMIDREKYFVYGKIIDHNGTHSDIPVAVAAYSDKYREKERVDIMYRVSVGTHYGLSLPEGEYSLVIFADKNRNGIYENNEVMGETAVSVNSVIAPQKALGQVDLHLVSPRTIDSIESIAIPDHDLQKQSLFYPAGSIRSLNDSIFDENVATLGMYDPASFLERAPTMFFALEEDLGYKIPVIFVHGIGGSARSFLPIVNKLDRKKYKPLFFYYPSGGDLDQLAEMFYRIFLSGKVVPSKDMPMVIIAHSMGGLIVREALNLCSGKEGENNVRVLFTLASPLGGHPAAALGEKHGAIVLPAWQDVNPASPFIKSLYRKPLPKSITHYLLYAYANPSTIKLNENSDGVVPLASQLHAVAQAQSSEQFGFNASHTGILESDEVIDYVLGKIEKVKNIFPEDHLVYLSSGGFDVDFSDDYSTLDQFCIRNYGRYYLAMSNGTLQPFHPLQEEFIKAVRGEIRPTDAVTKSWIRFQNEFADEIEKESQRRTGLHDSTSKDVDRSAT